MTIDVTVLRVFTNAENHFGNPLGVVDAASAKPADRQRIAAELGYSETIFVELPHSGSATAHAQIFTPVTELPFAGHPTVGAAWWLRHRGTPVKTLQVPAGVVQVRYSKSETADDLTGVIARAEWAPEFVISELGNTDELASATTADYPDDAEHYLWTWVDRERGHIRSRMFAPNLGVAEDEATGSAAVRITDHLSRDLTITQGRGSQIFTTWDPGGWVVIAGRVADDGSRRLG